MATFSELGKVALKEPLLKVKWDQSAIDRLYYQYSQHCKRLLS
jgi:hypothetical protein